MRHSSTTGSFLAGVIVTDDDLKHEVVCTHLAQLKKNGPMVEEDIIFTKAIFLQSNVLVYTVTVCCINFPIVYNAPHSDAITKSNILLAYYEPGQYQAVTCRSSGNGIRLSSGLLRKVPHIVPINIYFACTACVDSSLAHGI